MNIKDSFEEAFDNILTLIIGLGLIILHAICFVIEVLISLLPYLIIGYLIIGFILLKIFD